MGEGYNGIRKVGMQNEIDALTGDTGIAMQDAYNKIGQYKASLENQKAQLENDALQSVMSGIVTDSYADSKQLNALQEAAQAYKLAKADYYDASKMDDMTGMQEAGAAMGNALMEAQAIAANEYNGSEGAQLMLDSEISLANSIKDDSSSDNAFYGAGYKKGQAFSKGLASGGSGTFSVSVTGIKNSDIFTYGKAFGMSYVPYDNYPAMLHEGERVLTASEARGYGGGSASVKITGNSFVIREEADIDKVASALVAKIRKAQMLAVPG